MNGLDFVLEVGGNLKYLLILIVDVAQPESTSKRSLDIVFQGIITFVPW